MSDEPRLYTRDEWEAMSDHDRAVVAEDRRRAVEAERARHESRTRLLDDLMTERFGRVEHG